MLYDLDWSMWNTSSNFAYPVLNQNIPAVTYQYTSIEITRKLYQNSEFRDLYLKTLSYHLKNTFNPTRMNKIVDELASEIESEIPYHINRWRGSGMYPTSVDGWHNSVNNFKNTINNRYNTVLSRLRSELRLSYDEYEKYFGDVTS